MSVGKNNKHAVGLLSPATRSADADLLDNPQRWFLQSKNQINLWRSELLRATQTHYTQSPRQASYHLQQLQELVASSIPVDLSMQLAKAELPIGIEMNASDSNVLPPMGSISRLEQLQYESNPKVPSSIEHAWSDSDLLAREAIQNLYHDQITPHAIQRVFSVGMLGVEKKRTLVPTKWSITATDQTISNHLLESIRDFSTIDHIEVFEGNFLDNHFTIVLLPTRWSFENMECWQHGSGWNLDGSDWFGGCDFEGFFGRTKYVEETAGAYFAARLSVCEYLLQQKKQARVWIIRTIGSSYTESLGVWVIRETVKHALNQLPTHRFETNQELKKFLEQKLGSVMNPVREKSRAYTELFRQKRLADF